MDLKNVIVVLNDGETYTDVRGCTITEVPASESIDETEENLKNDEDKVIAFLQFAYGKVIIDVTEYGRDKIVMV